MSDKDRRNAAIRFYNEGVTQAQTGDKAIAFKMLNSSVEVDPSFPEGWFQVGNACGDNMPFAVASPAAPAAS